MTITVAVYLEVKILVVGIAGTIVVCLQMEKELAKKLELCAANIKNMTWKKENMIIDSLAELILNK
jgi:hypothetical protein